MRWVNLPHANSSHPFYSFGGWSQFLFQQPDVAGGGYVFLSGSHVGVASQKAKTAADGQTIFPTRSGRITA